MPSFLIVKAYSPRMFVIHIASNLKVIKMKLKIIIIIIKVTSLPLYITYEEIFYD